MNFITGINSREIKHPAKKECKSHSCQKAFTLAETLIAIVVIGIIAAVMLPAMNQLFQKKVRTHQSEVAQMKFKKAAEMMMLNGKMGPYYDNTYEFVKELSHYLKINQICRVGDSPNNLPPVASCFGEDYGSITVDSKGQTVELSDIKTGSDLGIDKNNDTNDWTSDNIGILTLDGTRLILSYNSKCAAVQEGVYGGDTSYACIAGVADVDGDKKPNTLGKDVYLFGSAKNLGKSCIANEIGMCLSKAVKISDLIASKGFATYDECMASEYGSDAICGSTLGEEERNENWFFRVVEECEGQLNMPSYTELNEIVAYLFDSTASEIPSLLDYGNFNNIMNNLFTYNEEKFAAAGLPVASFHFVLRETDSSRMTALTCPIMKQGDTSQAKIWCPFYFAPIVNSSDNFGLNSGYFFCKQSQ